MPLTYGERGQALKHVLGELAAEGEWWSTVQRHAPAAQCSTRAARPGGLDLRDVAGIFIVPLALCLVGVLGLGLGSGLGLGLGFGLGLRLGLGLGLGPGFVAARAVAAREVSTLQHEAGHDPVHPAPLVVQRPPVALAATSD